MFCNKMEAPSSIPLHLDCSVQVSRNDINTAELMKVLQYLKPSWKQSDLVYEKLTGGYINLIFKCYVKKTPDDCIVFRIWLKGLERLHFLLDRDIEVKLQIPLGERGIAPKILAIFKNGICCEYFNGEKLQPSLCKTDQVSRAIAKNLAIVHSMQLEGFKQRRVPFEVFECGLSIYPPQYPDPEKNKRLHTELPSKEEITKEVKFLEEYLNELELTVVQCHGDLHSTNMMQNKEGTVVFLDYELAHVGYAVEDLSYFLLALSVDYDNLDESTVKLSMPEEQYQKKFFRWYLEELCKETGKDPNCITEKDIQRLYIQVNKYYLIARFYGVMINVIFSAAKKEELSEEMQAIDFCQMTAEIIKNYYATKEEFTILKLPE